MTSLALILLGLLGLVAASEIAVGGARDLTRLLGVSPMIVGVTIAAFGTSLPEIATNLAVAFHGRAGEEASGIAVGNIVGSCLSQATLLLGITALIGRLRIDRIDSRRDGVMVLAALGLMWLSCADGVTERWEGLALTATYLAYLAFVVVTGRTGDTAREERKGRTAISVVKVLGGTVGLVVGAEVLMRGAVAIITQLGIPDTSLGLLLGVATGLPELALAIQATRHGLPTLAVGNLLGSNITDPLASYGLGASVFPVTVPPEVLRIDFPAWLIVSIVSLVLLVRPGGLTRPRAVVLLAMFAGYVAARQLLVG